MTRILSLLALLVFGLTGCQSVPAPRPADAHTRPPESALPEQPEGREMTVIGAQSELRIVLFPAGRMARAGHPHVIGGDALSGEIVLAEDFHDSTFTLEIGVGRLEVDRPEWRRDEGFDPDMSDSAIEGTGENLRSDDQLDAANHPVIRIESLAITGPPWQPDLDVRITLAGEQRELTVPVALEMSEERLVATGRFVIRQSEFGIEPFSAAGGALRVADEVLVRFRIAAAP